MARRTASRRGDVAARNPAGRCDRDRPGTFAVTDIDPTTPSHRPRSHQHQRRRRHRPRPALDRQHRPCQRLTRTAAHTATTKTTFGMTLVRDAVIGGAADLVEETYESSAPILRQGETLRHLWDTALCSSRATYELPLLTHNAEYGANTARSPLRVCLI